MAKKKKTTAAELAASEDAAPETEAPPAPEEEALPPPPPVPNLPPVPTAVALRNGKARDDGRPNYDRTSDPNAGPVALRTFVGIVDGVHRCVRRGAAARDIPQAVIHAMEQRGVQFGDILQPVAFVPRSPGGRAGAVVAKNTGPGNVRVR